MINGRSDSDYHAHTHSTVFLHSPFSLHSITLRKLSTRAITDLSIIAKVPRQCWSRQFLVLLSAHFPQCTIDGWSICDLVPVSPVLQKSTHFRAEIAPLQDSNTRESMMTYVSNFIASWKKTFHGYVLAIYSFPFDCPGSLGPFDPITHKETHTHTISHTRAHNLSPSHTHTQTYTHTSIQTTPVHSGLSCS